MYDLSAAIAKVKDGGGDCVFIDPKGDSELIRQTAKQIKENSSGYRLSKSKMGRRFVKVYSNPMRFYDISHKLNQNA
jgi:hypothetical protein